MKTYKKDVDLFLVDGEVVISTKQDIQQGDYWIYKCKHTGIVENEITLNNLPNKMGWFDKLHDRHSYLKVIYSTKQLQGIKPLERSKFIKPIDLKSFQDAYIHENNYYNYEYREQDVIKSAYEDGYNANKAQFTREDIINAISIGRTIFKGGKPAFSYDEIISKIQTLSLPESITINDNDEIVEVVW